MNTPTPVYLRADGNSQIGLGHVHRLLALSEILKDHFDCKFVIKNPLQGIRDLILKSCATVIEVDDAEGVDDLKILSDVLFGKEIVVLDGYGFGTDYQREVRKKGTRLACVDDIFKYHFVADVIINPAGGVSDSLYSKEPYSILYSGPGFAFLKKPFRDAAKNRVPKSDSAVLICMGGADPDNHTLLALRNILDIPFKSYHVVIGEAYRFKNLLLDEVKKSKKEIEVLTNLSPQELVGLMRRCSTAVCSASGIAYEYLSVGGTMYVKQTASNQNLLYNYLITETLAHKLEEIPVSDKLITLSGEKQKKIFDGNSDVRILKIFNRMDFDLNAVVRKANKSDLMTVFHWANDSELRRQSFNSSLISLESHETWFEKKLNDPLTFLYIFEYKNRPVAQIRFDVGEKQAVINYSIDKNFRGRGWGMNVLQSGIKKFQEDFSGAVSIVGFVKQENKSSNTIFRTLGFLESQATEYPGSYKYEYQKNKDGNKY